MDELIPYPPEPCETCDMGIGSMTGFDGVYRCRNCVANFAETFDPLKVEVVEEDTSARKFAEKQPGLF